MLKIAALVWVILGPTLAGSLVLIVITVPSLAAQATRMIPYAAATGFVLAIPFALLVAHKIQGGTTRSA